MKKNNALIRDSSRRLVDSSSSGTVLFILLLIFVLFPACSGKMSLEEAKHVTVSMVEGSFVPPPRRIDDILVVLNDPGQFDPAIVEKKKAIANQSPPESKNEEELANFYLKRGNAAFQIFRLHQALADRRIAFQHAENAGVKNPRLLYLLGVSEAWCGNFKFAIELFERSLNMKKSPSTYTFLVLFYTRIGDIESAEDVKRRGVNFCNRSKSIWAKIEAAVMEAIILEAKGKFMAAEKHRRKAVDLLTSIKGQSPPYFIVNRTWLAGNLKKQGRLIEAELEMRQTLTEAIGIHGVESGNTGVLIGALGSILQKQGRLDDAEKLIRTGVRIIAQTDIPSYSYLMGNIRMSHGNVLTDQNKFSEAVQAFDLARTGLNENKFLYQKVLTRNPNLMLSLLMTDHNEQALELITSALDTYQKKLGESHYQTAEILALRGLANVQMKKYREAVEDFSGSIPILLPATNDREADYSRNNRFRIIVETYIDLLAKIHAGQIEEEIEINALAEAFRLADSIRGQSVRSALGASVARAAVVEPELSDLVRREQDALKQKNVLQSMFSDVLATPKDQRLPGAIEKLAAKIDTLNTAIIILQDEIKRRFPKYADLTNPDLATVDTVRKHLRLGEALISIHGTDKRTYIWAIPGKGDVCFATVDFGNTKILQSIAHLRKALDPEPKTFGDIPKYDVSQAYELYRNLLMPVEKGWNSAADLIIVAHGPLGQLPFSVLPTEEVQLGVEEGELFSNYRKIPWLIRRVSITRLPSISSLVSLRALPEGDPNRKAFVGFGDPFFNEEQLALAEQKESTHQTAPEASQSGLHVRGIRVTTGGNLDSEKIISSHLDFLNRLPDTAEEIKSIAQTIGADLEQDVYLGKLASEHQVKTMDLSDRRIIAFATHALVPGDLDGLDQPALTLCSPTITGENEDGLLTVGEILKLKLSADWVVLSACNTGAAYGEGAEAVSGLGRAFFYAGTRAILVSMWPVETTSARKLTTNLFRYQVEDRKLPRARALRKSILELIDGTGLKDNATGKIIASYAHPIFWAPFVIVGDSGLDLN
jgi:CHAT domain-containing protein